MKDKSKAVGYVLRFEGIEKLACLACATKRKRDYGCSSRPVYGPQDHPGKFCEYCDALILVRK